MNNPIIDEIRQARADLAAEHDYDLARINEWARRQTEARRKARDDQAHPVKNEESFPASTGQRSLAETTLRNP